MDSKPDADALTGTQRCASGIIGALSFAAAATLLYLPPIAKQFPPQCAEPTCLTEMPTAPMSVIVALMAFGALLAVFAINGRRLQSLKVAGVEAEMARPSAEAATRALMKTPPKPEEAEEEEPPSDAVPTSKPTETITVSGVEYELYRLDDVPIRVAKDALTRIHPLPPGTLSRIEFIARRAGKGNHPWLLKLRDQDQTWKISYGGKGKKEEATVKALQ